MIGIPPGVDAGGLMNQLLSYGALLVPVIAAVGAFFLISKILKRAGR